ncbi:MAG: IclR family transcriptional regulator, partial [Corynebacterium sp.]|nr:IclR family transcriptional regulator [Corynebacterium sp.]
GVVVATSQSANMERFLPVLQATSQRINKATAHIPLDTLLASTRRDSRKSGR